MSFSIIWSDFAVSQLDSILEYHENHSSPEIARNLVKDIIEAPNILVRYPEIGPKEEMLKDRKIEYRYLIHDPFKLIYSVDKKNQYIKIADVFDTRQNPYKMRRAL
jgi:plasmid stabilization system protein ParE